MRRSSSRLIAGSLFGLGTVALVGGPACVGVLDLKDYRDAVAELCACDGEESNLPDFGSVDSCISVLSERLASVTPEAREAWLEYYAKNCDDNCNRAFECYQLTATCSFTVCYQDARECCGYQEGVTTCEGDAATGKLCMPAAQ